MKDKQKNVDGRARSQPPDTAACGFPSDHRDHETNLAAERCMLDARYLEESRRRFNAQTRNQQLRAVLQDASAFLEHIEWNDTTSEHDAENLRHQIDVALSTLDPTP